MHRVSLKPFFQKLSSLNWGIIFLITCISMIGWGLLVSAAGGDLSPWAFKQMIRFAVGLVIMLTIALTDIRIWLRLSYILYTFSFILLCGVEFLGFIGKGGQRWLDLYILQIQPSELMKITLVLALARYFHMHSPPFTLRVLVPPLMLILLPALLVLRQPDLGTAMILLLMGGMLFFVAEVSLWLFLSAFLALGAIFPFLWTLLHEYQKKRILIFLDPTQDTLGAGYHITQSKIALGSGGIWGKGYMQGTQAALNFLPEKQTDFIFTLLCEEYGFLGGTCLIALYIILLLSCFRIALTTLNPFGRFVVMGMSITFFLYFAINIAMVIGLVPVVGVPLPLVSYGGTSLLTLLMGFGFLLNGGLYRHLKISSSSLGLL